MEIQFDPNNKEQIAMIKDMGSKDKIKSLAAQEAFAAAIAPVAREVINNASTTAGIYQDITFNQDQYASIPLDTYYDEAAGYFEVWSQNTAGGLPSNFTHDVAEMKVQTYTLESAISMLKKYASQSRLDVVSKAITRLLNEVMIKQDTNGFLVLLKAIANASTRGTPHVFRTLTADVLQLADFNAALTRGKRVNSSYANGTPDSTRVRGITDLYMSPEMTEQIRSIAYQPMNTRSGAVATSGATSLAAPDSVREEIYRNGGAGSLYGIAIHELNEFGIGYTYNTLFSRFAGSYAKADGSSSSSFSASADELIVGIDRSRGGIYRPLAVNTDTGGTFELQPDDQFPSRSEKIGFWGRVEEGRVITDTRATFGIVV